MIKKQILILVSILLCNFAFAQPNYDFSTLVGKYDGHPFNIEKDEPNKKVSIRIELSADYTLSLSLKKEGVELEDMQAKLITKTAKLAENNSLEFLFEAADSESELTKVYFSIMPASTGYEGVFVTLKAHDNTALFFQMNKQGGNPEIPGATDVDFSGSTTEKLHQQMTALFSDLERGFTLSNGERKKGYTSYSSNLYIEGLTNGNKLKVLDNGPVYLYANVLSSQNSNSSELEHIANIENAIKSYSNSKGFQVAALKNSEIDKNYVVKKSGKAIGFLEIKKVKDKHWNFYLYKPLDRNKLKAEFIKGVELLENNFVDIQGGKSNELAVLGQNYKSTRTFYGASSSKIDSYKGDNKWLSSFKNYPYAALLYQIENMNLSFSGAKKTEEKKNDRGLFMTFEKQKSVFEISLYDFGKEGASLWINKKKDPNEVKVKNEKIQQYLSNVRWNMKGFGKSNDFIIATISKANAATSNFEKDGYLEDIAHKFEGLKAGTGGAIKEIKNAINEARNSGCPKTQEDLEKIKQYLITARDEFANAEGSIWKLIWGEKDGKNYGEKANKHATLAFENCALAEYEMSMVEISNPCYKTSSSSSNTSTPAYVAPAKTYDANDNYPTFSGRYEGDDLYQLMGRHWDDPAIKLWLHDSQYGFERYMDCDSEFCSYYGKGIDLFFHKSHLSKITLSNTTHSKTSFKGKLPKGIRLNAPASSINSIPVSWRQERSHYKEFKEGKNTTTVFFDHPSESKIEKLSIDQKIAVDSKEDLENNMVGVGLTFSLNNQGKVSINNSRTGYAAKKAGMYEGMWILEIDGKKVNGKDEYDIKRLLNGKKGTAVKIKFCRSYQEEHAKEYLLYRGAGGKAESVAAVKPSINYPSFNGKYEGDDLFQLLDRSFDDPAITKLINANTIKKINMGTDPKRKKMGGNGVGLEFYEDKLVKISLSTYAFKGQLPQGLQFGMSPYKTKTSNQLKWNDHGEPYIHADFNNEMELRADFDANSNVSHAKLTFVYLSRKPKKAAPKATPKTTVTKPIQPGNDNDIVGLGFTYGQGKDSDVYEVNWLTKSSAAYKAGVRRDDNIIKINGTPITGKPLADVKNLMQGKKGTSAKVIVERDGKEKECTIIR